MKKSPSRRGASTKTEAVLQVAGRSVPVSRLEKVFYRAVGFTKGQIIDYYIRASPVLLPHLKDRPLTLKRYPDGVDGGFFYEKRCPPYRPDWVQTVPVSRERGEDEIHYCVANDLPTIVWAANLGDLELHTSLAKGKKIDQPTMIVFDLDPGPPANIIDCAQVAFWLRDKLEADGLQSFAKTSGSKGLQIYVPLNTATSYEITKPYSHSMAQALEREHPDAIISRMEKRLRRGKVFVDWSQNDRHKTTVCVYSLRAKEKPAVSTPVTWDEVQCSLRQRDPTGLTFLSTNVLQRIEKHGDLFEPVLKLQQRI